MNGYKLSRRYFDWAFEHPERANTNSGLLYFFLIEVCNRLGWKEKFSITSGECMEATSMKSYTTYKKAFDLLVENGFIKVINHSKNQYSSNIIALIENANAHTKALDKALIKAPIKPIKKASVDHVGQSLNHKPSTDNLKQEYVHESSNPDILFAEELSELQQLVKEKYPNVASLKKQLTLKEAVELEKFCPQEVLIELLEAMENKPDLQKKYTSVNLTMRNWLRRRSQPTGQNGHQTKPSKGKVYDRFDDTAREILRGKDTGE